MFWHEEESILALNIQLQSLDLTQATASYNTSAEILQNHLFNETC